MSETLDPNIRIKEEKTDSEPGYEGFTVVDEESDDVNPENGEGSLREDQDDEDADSTVCDLTADSDLEKEEGEETQVHPYACVLETFEYSQSQLTATPVGQIKRDTDTPFALVNARGAFMNMLTKLRTQTEIGVYVAQDCKRKEAKTVQYLLLSTKETDYCIDALKLKNEVPLLTEIFINPKIVKVVRHKATLSLLQENLHLYPINIFDIGAARVIRQDVARWSIDSILKKDYNVERPKNGLDMAKRPLMPKVQTFLKQGVHYLIYMYYDLKNMFLAKDPAMYRKFLDECREAAKIMPKNKTFAEMNTETIQRALEASHQCEKEILKKLQEWRIETSDRHNITINQVLGTMNLFALVKLMPDKATVVEAVTKSTFVKQDIDVVLAIIREARLKHNVYKWIDKVIRLAGKVDKPEPKGKQKAKKRKAQQQPTFTPPPATQPRLQNAFQNWTQDGNSGFGSPPLPPMFAQSFAPQEPVRSNERPGFSRFSDYRDRERSRSPPRFHRHGRRRF